MKNKGGVHVKEKKRFPRISSLSFEHPTDAAALVALRKLPGIDKILRFLFGMIQEKRTRLFFLSSSVRVTDKQFNYVHDLFIEACEILDIEHRPELFIAQTPFANAFAFGIDRPFVIVNSALIDMLEPAELQVVLAHELGHVVSNHMLYYSILLTLTNLLRLGGLGIPFGNLALYAFVAALHEWFRKAELTSDRAALLVSQNIDTCFKMKMKFAGGRHTEHMSVEEFFSQADEYESHGDVVDSIYKILNNWRATHPHVVARMRELNRWYEQGNYRDILAGDYISRDSEAHADMSDTWKNAFQNLKQDIDDSGDTLTRFVSELFDAGGNIVNAGAGFFKNIFFGGSESKKDV
ncbi:M48 family metallopeptidase [bacterium]|nr:M48 family metallopeptidase [bacterium]